MLDEKKRKEDEQRQLALLAAHAYFVCLIQIAILLRLCRGSSVCH